MTHKDAARLTLLAFVAAGVSCAEVNDPVSAETSPLSFRSTSFPEISVAWLHCKGEFRCQAVDIVDLGANSFVIGYIDANRNLRYQYWTTVGGQQGASILAGTDAFWVRANTSNSGDSFGSAVNYFAVQVSDPQKNPTNNGHGVFLDKFTKTGSNWSMTRTLVESLPSGARRVPAVATKGTPLTGDLFFGWFSTQGYVGRLLRFRYPNASAWTSTFPIIGANFSSDVIYNTSSNKWIVKLIEEHPMNMTTWNTVWTSEWDSLPSPVESSTVGRSGDGHHTAVAYNPLSSDGSYISWHEDHEFNKAVYVYDNMGHRLNVPLPEAPHLTGFSTIDPTQDPPSVLAGLTVPVARTSSASVPYVFLKPSGLYGLRADKTWTLIEEFQGGLQQPYAMRSLSTETVALYKDRLIISDWPGSPTLFAMQDWVGSVDAFYTGGLTEKLHTAWQTGYSGSETFESSLIDLNRATEITASTDVEGRNEVFYVGTDYVVRHLRETAAGSNAYEDPGEMTTTPIKAKKLVAASNWDASVSLFYIRYPDGVLCYTRQTQPSSSTWTAEALLAGATTKARRIAVGQIPGGQLQVVFTDISDVLWQTYQTAASENTWSSAGMVGTSNSKAREILLMRDDAISYNLRLVYTKSASDNTDTYVMQSAQTAPGSWTAPSMMFQTGAKQISMSWNKSLRLHLVFVASNDVVYQAHRQASGAWSAISPLRPSEPKAKRVSAMRNSGNDGRLEVFYIGLDDVVYRTSQTGSNLGERDFYAPQALSSW